jgi:hypothetical protein
MANISVPANPAFPDVYQWDFEDDVIGGEDGIATLPIKQLTERTAYLKDSPAFTGTPTVPTPDAMDTGQTLVNAEWTDRRIGYGDYRFSSFELSPAELAARRWLPLNGQVVEIAAYQRLCDREWVGAAANATADWWYRTSDPQGLVRDPDGAYMVVLDMRGLFLRAAGQNSKYKMANDAPYDGMGIGAFLGDAIRNITGYVGNGPGALLQWIDAFTEGGALFTSAGTAPIGTGNGDFARVLFFDASRVVPVAGENRSASISAFPCITY